MEQLFVDSQSSKENYTQNTANISFSASTNQITHLSDVISSINTINPNALMIIKQDGIIFYTEYNNICSVHTVIDPTLFVSYNFYIKNNSQTQNDYDNEELGTILDRQNSEKIELRLGVDLRLIHESFNSVSNNLSIKNATNNQTVLATCYIIYEGEGNPLIIEFEDSLISEKIEFATFYSDLRYPFDQVNNNLHLVIDHKKLEFDLILKSDIFYCLLQDLHQINSVDLFILIFFKNNFLNKRNDVELKKLNFKKKQFYISNQLNFISKGSFGHLKLVYPKNEKMLEKLLVYSYNKDISNNSETNIKTLISCYKFNIFEKIFKAVKLSYKCKMLKDLNGILSIQLLCKNSNLLNYTGTLITFNLTETSMSHDSYNEIKNLENIFYQIFNMKEKLIKPNENNVYGFLKNEEFLKTSFDETDSNFSFLKNSFRSNKSENVRRFYNNDNSSAYEENNDD